MKINVSIIAWMLIGALALPIVSATAQPAADPEKTFDELCKRVQRGKADVTEADVISLINQARTLGHPFAAESALKLYSAAHPSASPQLILPMARNAMLAGDYRAAAARYKSYLRAAPAGRESSDAAAALYTILIQFLGSESEAFQIMKTDGEKYRGSDAAKRFDIWFLDKCQAAGDFGACVKRLVSIYGDKMEPERERYFHGHSLAWAMESIKRPGAQHFTALPDIRTLAPLIRAEGPAKLKYAFYLANLEFKAATLGKAAEDAAQAFNPVMAAAKAYFDAAPSKDTLLDIEDVFSAGFKAAEWQLAQAAKRDFFAQAFSRLPPGDKIETVKWMQPHTSSLLTQEQMAKLVLAEPAAFAGAAQFTGLPGNPEVFKKMAPALSGESTPFASAVRALAGGAGLDAAATLLAEKESWNLPAGSYQDLVSGPMWKAIKSYPGNEALDQASFDKALAQLGRQTLSKTPLFLLDHKAAAAYVMAMWNQEDKSQVPGLLQSLSWIPYSEQERLAVFDPAYKAFVKWAGEVGSSAAAIAAAKSKIEAYDNALQAKKRAEAAKASAKTDAELKAANSAFSAADALAAAAAGAAADAKAVIEKLGAPTANTPALISPIEAAFKQLLDPGTFAPDKAPSPLCRNLALAAAAIRGKKLEDFEKAADAAYAELREFPVKKTPFGGAALEFLMTSRPQMIETIDFQVKVLADQLALFDRTACSEGVAISLKAIALNRAGWPAAAPAADRPQATKVNEALENHLLTRLGKNMFDPLAFEWLRMTRKGNGWINDDAGGKVLGLMITQKSLLNVPFRPNGWTASGAYMWLIRNEFPKLKGQFPPETFFDAMFLEECAKSNSMDIAYWNIGTDSKGKITSFASKWLQGFQKLPMDFKSFTPDKDLWKWHNICLRSTAAWRKERAVDEAERGRLAAMLDAAWGKTRFDEFAMGEYYFLVDADTSSPEGRKAFFDKLGAFIARIRAVPYSAAPPSMGAIAKLENITDAETAVLLGIFKDAVPLRWPAGRAMEVLPPALHNALMARGRRADLMAVIPYFWTIGRDLSFTPLFRQLAGFANAAFTTNQVDLAALYSGAGMDMAGSALPEDISVPLRSIKMKAMVGMGNTIPVDPTDQRYPVFAAQTAFLAGNFENALTLYQGAAQKIPDMIKELDPEFTLWLVAKDTEAGEHKRAENLCRAMMQWIESLAEGNYDREIRGRIMLAYANIALAREEYPRARAQLERIVVAKEFEGSKVRKDAEIRIAEVDRLAKNYDAAIQRLEKLIRNSDRGVQIEAAYQLALVRFEKQEYVEAKDLLDQVFALEPNHTIARILAARIDLEMKKYAEATDIQGGSQTAQNILVPGRPLKIQLDDRTLATAGRSSSVEIRIWTDSGDEEFLFLLPSGESKTKFTGTMPTKLDPFDKNDHVLQVLGRDVIHYDYSDAFKRANNATNTVARTLETASDSQLAVTSGRILSEREENQFFLEQLIRDQQGSASMIELRREGNIVRPGNPIYVRVIDSDASVSAKKDTVNLQVRAAYSGDKIDSFPIEETGTHSGIFQGQIPTLPAGAMAYATDSEEGRLPIYAIIAAGQYPPWEAMHNNTRPKLFTVDLNDNVPLGKLVLTADTPGRRLKSFAIQTSINNKEYTTVGAWPTPFEVWNGTPSWEFVNLQTANLANSIAAIRQYIGSDSVGRDISRAIVPMTNLFAKPGSTVMSLRQDRIPLKWAKDAFVGHFRAAFYVPSIKTRTFQLDTRGQTKDISFFFTIDSHDDFASSAKKSRFTSGRTATLQQGRLTIKRQFKKGVHFVNIYCKGLKQADCSLELLCDSDEPPYIVSCPSTMFDPGANPEIARALPNRAAAIAPDKDGNVFDIQFATNTQARTIRFVLSDFETDAPAIRKIALSDAAGKAILPSTNDILASGRNQVLEIVSGDKISIAYEDTRVYTKGREKQEKTITAEFQDADITACVTVFEPGRPDVPRITSLYRYVPGEKVEVAVTDPDHDISPKRDTLSFSVRTQVGKPVEIQALETDEHSGVFIGALFPVLAAPQRPNEIQVGPEEDLILSFMDRENVDPGVPIARQASVPAASSAPPQLRVYSVQSRAIDPARLLALSNEIARLRSAQVADAQKRKEEYIAPSRELIATRPVTANGTQAVALIRGAPILAELIYPVEARSGVSRATLYAQTAADRERAGIEPGAPFSPDVPNTTNFVVEIGDFRPIEPPPGYISMLVQGNPYAASPEIEGRFSFVLEDIDDREVVLGFPYADAKGITNWITRRVVMTSDAFFDIMDRYYNKPLDRINVGDFIYLRVSNKSASGKIPVSVSASSGFSTNITMSETFEGTGIFKSSIRTVFAGDTNALAEPGVVPANYGDTITVSYSTATNAEPIARSIAVNKGSDGVGLPFTKRFADPEIAVRTQFTMAEALFELAKKHRGLEQESLARREIAQGRKLLEEAVKDYPNTETRIQADYLLADLDLEFANDVKDENMRKRKYLESINRFKDIILTYPDSPYAPKAQYKMALAYEKMGDIDQACEEYVKLSYTYPDSDLIAETIARIGNYFAAKGKELETKIAEQTEKREIEKYGLLSTNMFRTAADVFSRLAPRFPTHQLAGKTLVISGQCYYRAGEHEKGIGVLDEALKVIKDDNDLAAEAMYWKGDIYKKTKNLEKAYRQFKQLTWDHPSSKWAKFARGQLLQKDFQRILEEDMSEQ